MCKARVVSALLLLLMVASPSVAGQNVAQAGDSTTISIQPVRVLTSNGGGAPALPPRSPPRGGGSPPSPPGARERGAAKGRVAAGHRAMAATKLPPRLLKPSTQPTV